MNPFTLLFRLPLMPLSKVVQLGEVLRDHAEQQLRDPASVRRQLEQAEQAHAAGEISEEELARVQAPGDRPSAPCADQQGDPGRRHAVGTDLHG